MHAPQTRKPLENAAFIDGQNLHKGVQSLNLEIDYYRLRHYLRAKFGVKNAYIFLGYIKENEKLYTHLRDCGFELIFKEVAHTAGQLKGNVDVLLTLYVMKLLDTFEKAILITSDGDFAPLIEELDHCKKFAVLISPSKNKSSYLLRKVVGKRHVSMSVIKNKICKLKKRTADR